MEVSGLHSQVCLHTPVSVWEVYHEVYPIDTPSPPRHTYPALHAHIYYSGINPSLRLYLRFKKTKYLIIKLEAFLYDT